MERKRQISIGESEQIGNLKERKRQIKVKEKRAQVGLEGKSGHSAI